MFVFLHVYPKVLCITHELSTPDVRLPYLAHIFHPVPVLTFFGRSAKMEPPGKVDETLWYCWKGTIQRKTTGQ